MFTKQVVNKCWLWKALARMSPSKADTSFHLEGGHYWWQQLCCPREHDKYGKYEKHCRLVGKHFDCVGCDKLQFLAEPRLFGGDYCLGPLLVLACSPGWEGLEWA